MAEQPMSDQPLTLGHLEQWFRSFARPDLDLIAEEREAEARERGQRWWVRSASSSLDFLESMYGFLRDDIRRLEQRLDEVHVRVARDDASGVPGMIENARYKYEASVATRGRIERYLIDLEAEIDRVDDDAVRGTLDEQSRDLRRRLDELTGPLDVVGRRLDRYRQRA